MDDVVRTKWIVIDPVRIRDDVILRLVVVHNADDSLAAWSSGWERLTWLDQMIVGMRAVIQHAGYYCYQWHVN